MKVIRNLAALDKELEAAEALRSRSETAFIERLTSFHLALEPAEYERYGFNQPSDSVAFLAGQFKLYEQIAQKPYALANEETLFDLEAALRVQHPYAARDAQMVSDFLISYAHLIRVANLPAGARILEVGSGYGSLTVHLAAMGYDVTCLDISQPLLTYVQRRCQQHFVEVKTICGDMAEVHIDGPFDAVLFFESFHHASHHRQTLQRLSSLLTPEGMVIFGAEPIVGDDSPFVPYDWGIRLDGLSLWSIRRFGWLELGFRESYFRSLLAKRDWQTQRHQMAGIPHSDVWIARQMAQPTAVAAQAIPEPAVASHAPLVVVPEPVAHHVITSLDETQIELRRLRQQIHGYENGRFIKFMKWLRQR